MKNQTLSNSFPIIKFFVLPDLRKGLPMDNRDVFRFLARELRISPDEAAERISTDGLLDVKHFIKHKIIIVRRDSIIMAVKYVEGFRRQQHSLYFEPGMPVAVVEHVQEDPQKTARIAAANAKRIDTRIANMARAEKARQAAAP